VRKLFTEDEASERGGTVRCSELILRTAGDKKTINIDVIYTVAGHGQQDLKRG
jgi:hypothetical protein